MMQILRLFVCGVDQRKYLGRKNMNEKVILYILQDETGYSLVSSNGADYGVVADDITNAIGMAKEVINSGLADEFCVDE